MMSEIERAWQGFKRDAPDLDRKHGYLARLQKALANTPEGSIEL